MFKNFLSNLGKPCYRSVTRPYSNSMRQPTQNLQPFQLIEALKEEFEVSDLENSLGKKVDLKELEPRIKLLKDFGFNDINCFKIVKNYPTILNIPKEVLRKVIDQWSLCNLEERNVKSILIYQPHFLSLSDDEIRKRIAYFHSLSRNKNAISKLIIENPNVMTDDWNSVLAKMNYLQREKRIAVTEILKSKALSIPLNVIKLRISILEKCGIFKVIKVMPHKTKTVKHQNPTVDKITDLSDENFAIFTAHISEEEYMVCSELYSNIEAFDNEYDSDEEDSYKR